MAVEKPYVPRLLQKYREEVRPAMQEKFQYSNPMMIPKIVKVVANMGVGDASKDIKELNAAEVELQIITGQKPVTARAKISVAQFKIRQGMPVGCFVTLRGHRMFEFYDRLLNVAIPRIRDFRGLPANAFDGRGNHSLGIREHNIFVELEYNMISKNRGMNITTVTNAKTDEEAKELLRLFGMPFRTA
jgi:large subunit ribosomal protein L5